MFSNMGRFHFIAARKNQEPLWQKSIFCIGNETTCLTRGLFGNPPIFRSTYK